MRIYISRCLNKVVKRGNWCKLLATVDLAMIHEIYRVIFYVKYASVFLIISFTLV